MGRAPKALVGGWLRQVGLVEGDLEAVEEDAEEVVVVAAAVDVVVEEDVEEEEAAVVEDRKLS